MNIEGRDCKRILEPGTKLLENKIAEELHVSRTPVREAIQKLVAEGNQGMAGKTKLIANQERRGIWLRLIYFF